MSRWLIKIKVGIKFFRKIKVAKDLIKVIDDNLILKRNVERRTVSN